MPVQSRLDKLRASIDPILTGIVQGVSNEAFISELLLPTIPVDTFTGQFPVFSNGGLKIHKAKRALKQDEVQRIPNDDYTMDKYKLEEYALEASIDHMEEEAAKIIVNYQEFMAKNLMDSLLLGQEYERVQLCTDATNFASGSSDALSGADCWDNTGSHPIIQIQDAVQTIRHKTLQKPNTLVLGQDSFIALQNHADLLEKIKYTQLGIVTEDLISAIISTKTNPINVVVGTGMYEDPANPGTYVDLWGDVAVLAYVTATKRGQRSKYESTFGYTFQKAGYPYAAADFGDYGLTSDFAVFLSYQAQITKNSAGFLFTNVKGS